MVFKQLLKVRDEGAKMCFGQYGCLPIIFWLRGRSFYDEREVWLADHEIDLTTEFESIYKLNYSRL